MKKTLLVYSGGLDSTSALYIHKHEIAMAVSFNYGSRHNEEEIKRAAINCELLDIPHKIVDMKEAFRNIKSALLGDSDIPYGHYEDLSMKTTVVPFRNAIMISIATGIAETYKLESVMLGSHKGDNAVYPDCRPEFNSFMNLTMQAGTYDGIHLLTPFQDLDKRQLAVLGIAAGMEPELTYSCYEGGPQQCGECSTCIERLWALGELSDEDIEGLKDDNN